MSKYKTITHVSKNEHGDEEIELVYRNGWFRTLFNLPEKRETYVANCYTWRDKTTLKRADAFKQVEISDAIQYLKYNAGELDKGYNYG